MKHGKKRKKSRLFWI